MTCLVLEGEMKKLSKIEELSKGISLLVSGSTNLLYENLKGRFLDKDENKLKYNAYKIKLGKDYLIN